MVRFLHTSDWQLGMGRSYLAPDEALPRFQQDRIDAVGRLGELAAQHGAAFVVVAGDVFETNQPEPLTVARTCDALRRIAVPVFLLPGNHDPLDGASVFRSSAFVAACPDHVVVLDDTTPRELAGAQVVGAPWRSKRPLEDLAAAALDGLDPTPAGVVRVLVAHGATDAGVAPDRDDPAVVRAAVQLEAVERGVVDYVALGDRHSTLDAGGHGRLWYSGAPEPTAFDEDDPGNVLVVDVEPGAAPVVTPVRVGRWRFVVVEEELRDEDSVDRLAARLDEVEDPARAIVRCKLRGVVSLAARARLDRVLEERRALLACLDLPDRHDHLVTEPTPDDLDRLDLRGYARDALEELRDGGHPLAGDALAELYRLAVGGAA